MVKTACELVSMGHLFTCCYLIDSFDLVNQVTMQINKQKENNQQAILDF
jgi:hypothetical protein